MYVFDNHRTSLFLYRTGVDLSGNHAGESVDFASPFTFLRANIFIHVTHIAGQT